MKCIAKFYNRDTQKYEEKDATILHWGISYEECRDGIGQYTVVFVSLENGEVHEVHPSLIRIIK